MRLELNTNGAWRVVLRGLQAGQRLEDALAAAQCLALIAGELAGPSITWRLVSEADDRVLAHCTIDGEWIERPRIGATA